MKNYKKIIVGAVVLTLSAIEYHGIKEYMAERELNTRHKTCCTRLKEEAARIADEDNYATLGTLENKLWCESDSPREVEDDEAKLWDYIGMKLLNEKDRDADFFDPGMYMSYLCSRIYNE